MWKTLKIIGLTLLLLIVVFVGGMILSGHVLLSVNENALPQFVKANYIDMGKIRRISKFRSGAGHSYVDMYETCRSMKHYFDPTVDLNNFRNPIPGHPDQPYTNIFSPVDGTITSMTIEHTPIGQQIHITPNGYPAYTVILFHIYPLDGIKPGTVVHAGEKIGYIGATQDSDVAVTALTWKGPKDFSYFDFMTDSVFAQFAKRGITSRQEMIISKAERDANPLTCSGEMFSSNQFNPADWVELN